MKEVTLTNQDVRILTLAFASRAAFLELGTKIFPIPRDGVTVAYAVQAVDCRFDIVDDPAKADFFLDAVIDSGRTGRLWCEEYPNKPFMAIIDKSEPESLYRNQWVRFPWEGAAEMPWEDMTAILTRFSRERLTNRVRKAGERFLARDNITAFLQNDDTVERIAKMYLREVFKGRYLPPPKTHELR